MATERLEDRVDGLLRRLQAIEDLARATTQEFREDSVVDMASLSGAGLVAFMSNFSDERLTEIVGAIAVVKERRLHAPRQVMRAHDKEEEEDLDATRADRPRAGTGIYIEGEGVVRP